MAGPIHILWMKTLQAALMILFLIGFGLGFVGNSDRSLTFAATSLSALSLILLIAVSSWIDAKHPAWVWLAERYGVARNSYDEVRCEEHRVFFRENVDAEFDSHNVIRVYLTDSAIEFQPASTTLFVEPIKIPKVDLEFVKDIRMTVVRRSIFRVRDSSVEIALTRAFVRRWRDN